MNDLTSRRKIQHIDIINGDPEVDRARHFFEALRLRHRALPELDLQDVDPGVDVLGKRLRFPLLISSMTGGPHDVLQSVNANLARAAQACGVAMGVGSQRVMFDQPAARDSFALRRHAPDALLFANLGAVQLNKGFGLDHCREAVETVGADALYLHLNPLQEAVQPEGDTHFAGLAGRIGEIAQALPVPVAVKEVGAGISAADASLLLQTPVDIIDVAGTGGTSWSRIEHQRHDNPDNSPGLAFQDWGIPTPLGLWHLKPYRNRITLFASGGIRNGIDMVKAVALGATACGLASPFLKPAMESAEAVIRVIERLRREFTIAMFLCGVSRIESLRGNETLFLTGPHELDW